MKDKTNLTTRNPVPLLTAMACTLLLAAAPMASAAQQGAASQGLLGQAWLDLVGYAEEKGGISAATAETARNLADRPFLKSEIEGLLHDAERDLATAPQLSLEEQNNLKLLSERVPLEAAPSSASNVPPFETTSTSEQSVVVRSVPERVGDRVGGGDGGGDPSGCMRCGWEYYACVSLCAIAFLLCVAATSGWGYFLCVLLWIGCVAECIQTYCVRVRCPPEENTTAESRRQWSVSP